VSWKLKQAAVTIAGGFACDRQAALFCNAALPLCRPHIATGRRSAKRSLTTGSGDGFPRVTNFYIREQPALSLQTPSAQLIAVGLVTNFATVLSHFPNTFVV
jgi:hypothetical protein